MKKINENVWKAIVNLMDDDKRFMANWEVDGEYTEEKFLYEYLKLDPGFEDVLKSEFSIEL